MASAAGGKGRCAVANHAIVGQLIRLHFHLIAAMISHATVLDAHYIFGFYLIFIFIMLFSCVGYAHAAPQIASSLVALVRRVKKYENKTNLNMHNMASAILTTSPFSPPPFLPFSLSPLLPFSLYSCIALNYPFELQLCLARTLPTSRMLSLLSRRCHVAPKFSIRFANKCQSRRKSQKLC